MTQTMFGCLIVCTIIWYISRPMCQVNVQAGHLVPSSVRFLQQLLHDAPGGRLWVYVRPFFASKGESHCSHFYQVFETMIYFVGSGNNVHFAQCRCPESQVFQSLAIRAVLPGIYRDFRIFTRLKLFNSKIQGLQLFCSVEFSSGLFWTTEILFSQKRNFISTCQYLSSQPPPYIL